MSVTKNRFFLVVAAFAATVGCNATIAHGVIACGSVVSSNDVMTADLNCAVDNPAFSVTGGAAVDMSGHQVTKCIGCVGISLDAGSKLMNGSIVGTGGTGACVTAASGSKIENVVASNCEYGFRIQSSSKLRNCAAIDTVQGFNISGDNNSISRCYSGGASSDNFAIGGNGNKLIESASVNASGSDGILVIGNANKVHRNVSSGDQGTEGLKIWGNENKASLNTVNNASGIGFNLDGENNKITKTFVTNSGTHGIQVTSDTSDLSKSASYDNGMIGILINGDANNLNANNASNNAFSGIRVATGTANSLKSNITMRNGDTGVRTLAGVFNTSITKTVAVGNVILDLQDASANCGSNVWDDNVFGTSDAGGVMNHACIK